MYSELLLLLTTKNKSSSICINRTQSGLALILVGLTVRSTGKAISLFWLFDQLCWVEWDDYILKSSLLAYKSHAFSSIYVYT